MTTGCIFNIMVGSPNDVEEYAKIALSAIHEWNIVNSLERRIALVPHHWTSSSYPSLNKPAQSHIDDILVERSDALIAIFGSRIGSPTETSISGTIEEIEHHRIAGKPVMVFFCESLDFNQNIEELKAVQDYRKNLKGLYETFKDHNDFAKKVASKLHLLIQNELQSDIKLSIATDPIKDIYFSDSEKELVVNWCKASSNYYNKHNFMGGKCGFSFSGRMIATETPKEAAEMDDFIERLFAAGYLINDGFDSKGKPKAKLTLLAYKTFGE